MDDQQRVVVLGTADAVATAERDNTFLVFDSPSGALLIDCAGSPAHKLLRSGVDPHHLRGAILTHAHPDHIYGLPSLIHHLHLTGRTEPLHIYALAETRRAAEGLLETLDLKKGFLVFHVIPEKEGYLLIEDDEYLLHTSPACHILPSVALRITSRISGRSLVYSSDTGPCPALVDLAQGADVLIHEASVMEPSKIHTTPWQAAELAERCGVGRLVLIHYPQALLDDLQGTLIEVRKRYGGEVHLAEAYDVYYL